LGSRGVAMAVTHPAWPLSEPLKLSVSAMVLVRRRGGYTVGQLQLGKRGGGKLQLREKLRAANSLPSGFWPEIDRWEAGSLCCIAQ
jgi:hypothetical protein